MIDNLMNIWNTHAELYYAIIMFGFIILTLWISSLKSVQWHPCFLMPMLLFSVLWVIFVPFFIVVGVLFLIGRFFAKINGTNDLPEEDMVIAEHKSTITEITKR